MPAPSGKTCENCQHLVVHDDRLECHCHPPVWKESVGQGGAWPWPIVTPDDWCGEWAAALDDPGPIDPPPHWPPSS